MPKSLLLVLPVALLVCAPPSIAQTAQRSAVMSSGRSASRDVHEAWFRQAIGDILEGRTASAKRDPGH